MVTLNRFCIRGVKRTRHATLQRLFEYQLVMVSAVALHDAMEGMIILTVTPGQVLLAPGFFCPGFGQEFALAHVETASICHNKYRLLLTDAHSVHEFVSY